MRSIVSPCGTCPISEALRGRFAQTSASCTAWLYQPSKAGRRAPWSSDSGPISICPEHSPSRRRQGSPSVSASLFE